MTTNLNQYPYYDDYDESKDVHQILFKPSIPVQARELTQTQTILQNQISRFGDHMFNNGSRVNGAKISYNTNIFALAISSTTLGGLSVGNYIKGLTSGMVGEIVDLLEQKDNKSYIIYVPRGVGSNGKLFSSAETIVGYVDGKLDTQLNVSFTTETETVFDIVATGTKGKTTITLAAAASIAIGSYIYALDAYVIKVDGLTITLNKELPDNLAATVLSAVNQPTTPTILIGVTDGVFYTGGRFARVGTQQIVPDVKSRWITKSIGLIATESFVTSDDDQTLLDPAQGSYNYMAPGADRLKVSLDMIAYNDTDVKDQSFIELFRFENGDVIRQNESTEYATIMKTLAERTYDESGNYVVSPFLIQLLDLGDPNTITASISPGKAYVGGYEFETISTTKLTLDRALDTEQASNFGINTYLGSYFEINTIDGVIPANGTTVTFKNASDATVGTAILLTLSPRESGNTRVYVTDINGAAISTATKIVAGTMTANMVGQITDVQNNMLVFTAPQSNVKTTENIDYTTPRVYRNVPFTNGVAILSTIATNERFAGGTGILQPNVANEYYQVFNASGHTITQVDVKSYIPGTLAQVEISINSTTYNGYGDIVLMVEVNDDAGRTKTLNQHGILLNSLSTTYQSLKRADFHKLQYATILNDDDIYAGKWTAISHPIKTVVYDNGIIYRALVQTTTDQPSETNTDWEIVADISNLLTVDPGQRNAFYDHAYVRFTSESPITTVANRIVVVFDFFKHTGFGPITVNSYPLDYKEIPEFTGSNGLIYKLKNCLDFRPRRVDDSTTISFESTQFPTEAGAEANITYYLSRYDKIVITNDRQFKVLKGISSYYAPRPPNDIPNAMTIALIKYPPYTDDVSAISLKLINNRRYTMKDIGLLDTRITNVEKYTNLNTLENRVLNKTYYGTNGLELFKSGFLTDGFDSYLNGNTISPEYRCSIDTKNGVARPMFSMDSVQLDMDENISTSRKTTTLVTAPYTEKVSISNRIATGTINVNPFNIVTDIGQLKISPSSDYWFDTKTLPIIYATSDNSAAFIQAQKQAATFNANAQWSAWSVIWSGITSTVESTNTGIVIGPTPPTRTISFIGSEISERTKLKATVGETSAIVSDNTVTVSKEIQPYARTKELKFEIFGLTPNIRVYGWIDDVSVDKYITPNTTRTDTVVAINVTNGGSGYVMGNTTVSITGGDYDATAEVTKIENGVIKEIRVTSVGSGYAVDPIVTINGGGTGTGATAVGSRTVPNKGTPVIIDNKGYASGTLIFPNDENVKFPCGRRRVVFGDTPTKQDTNSFADAIYTTEGYINTNQRTITSTKVPKIITSVSAREQTSREIVVATRELGWNDPLAQSFLVDPTVNPHGVFATGFNFFFSSKDPIVPITAEIRPLVNGYPSSTEVIPSSVVIMEPDDIFVSDDAMIATKFTFEDPVFLPVGEYAVILMSGSNKYNVFISEMNKVQLGTNTAVSKQPYLGSLFESQNASTWTAEQMKDLCFEMMICEFELGTTTLVLKNEAKTSDVNIDVFNIMAQNLQPELTTISTVVKLPNGYSTNVDISSDVDLDSMLSIKNSGDATVTMSLTTTNKDVSPVIDLERTAIICIHNLINDKTDATIPETDKREGSAISKYVLKTVTLNDGFSASSLCVQLRVNRPVGSSIQVFARMRNEYDIIPLSQKSWVLLNQEINGGNTSTADDYVEDMWSVYDYAYDGFAEFNQFEVKVVFWSSSSANVPTLDDIRAVALA